MKNAKKDEITLPVRIMTLYMANAIKLQHWSMLTETLFKMTYHELGLIQIHIEA